MNVSTIFFDRSVIYYLQEVITMLFFYWLFVGWWLEPILLIFKAIFWLFIGIPANILKYTFALVIVIALGALAVAMIATVGAFLIIPTLVISALICIASMLAGKKRKIKK